MIAARHGDREGASDRAAYILRLKEILAIVSKDPHFHNVPDLDIVETIRAEISLEIHALARELRDRHVLAEDLQGRQDRASRQ